MKSINVGEKQLRTIILSHLYEGLLRLDVALVSPSILGNIEFIRLDFASNEKDLAIAEFFRLSKLQQVQDRGGI